MLSALVPMILGSCTLLPVIGDKPPELALPVPDSGPLVKASRSLANGRAAGDSSFLLLNEAEEALKWRLALIDSARSSIDIQLYLWHGGTSSELLYERAIQAADRGVRVRILVDDFLLRASNVSVATLCRHHPNFEVRIFNPGRVRGSKIFGMTEMLANFNRLNRRMHNKTFTADRCMTIVGGRNIGDHYFGMDENYNFVDLDVLVAGPVVREVSDGFDKFWNDAASFPGMHLSKRDDPQLVELSRRGFKSTIEREKNGKLRGIGVGRGDWSGELAALRGEMVRGKARFIQDDPDPSKDKRVVATQLKLLTRTQQSEIRLASPYLLPSDEGVDQVAEMHARGVDFRVIVPSLAANNHAAVHGHYEKSRQALVEGGARLSEFRADPSEEVRDMVDVGGVRCERVNFHLKAVVSERDKCFIGSLNIDPRAVNINTECGLLIESPALAGEVADLLDELSSPQNSWQVKSDGKGGLTWESRGEVRSEPPSAGWVHRMMARVSGWLPIKNQL
ncbi:phospholipase D family protein [Haloferula chungangensis]|uniref:Phospholipase D family protein n=1 Tax=Haloferula chungangensis TaxID=1048331 RepID=A0ABW2L8R6_9BACT